MQRLIRLIAVATGMAVLLYPSGSAVASGGPDESSCLGPEGFTKEHRVLLDIVELAAQSGDDPRAKGAKVSGITFWEHSNWDGLSFERSSGQSITDLGSHPSYPGLFKSWNDRISSIQMDPTWGWMTFLWEDSYFGGNSLLVTANVERLGEWNERASSLRVGDRVHGLAYAPARSAPAGSAPVPIQPSGTITERRPVFEWSSLPGVHTYRLAIKSATDDTYVLEVTTDDTEFTLPYAVPTDQVFNWWVRAEPVGTWSAPMAFRYTDDEALYYAEILYSAQRYYYAYRTFHSLLADDPENLRVIMGKATVMYVLAGIDAAIVFLESRQLSTPFKQEVVAAIGDMLRREYGAAELHLDSALSTGGDEVYLAHHLKAMVQYSERRYGEAIASAQSSIAANAAYPPAHFMLGDIYRVLGQTEDLVDAWLQYLDVTPDLGTKLDRIRNYVHEYLLAISGRGGVIGGVPRTVDQIRAQS